MLAHASAVTHGGQFHLRVPNGTRWVDVERGISDYLIAREVSLVEPGELPPLLELVESDLPPQSVVNREGRTITVAASLATFADSSLDPAGMSDEERAAIVAGELGRQYQPVTEGRRYWIRSARSLKFVWLDRRKLLAQWRIEDARTEERRTAIRLLLLMVQECRLSRGERRIAEARCRMADTEPAAFVAPPRHATPIRSDVVVDASGFPCPKFDAVFAAELPYLPQPTRFPAEPNYVVGLRVLDRLLAAARKAMEPQPKDELPIDRLRRAAMGRDGWDYDEWAKATSRRDYQSPNPLVATEAARWWQSWDKQQEESVG